MVKRLLRIFIALLVALGAYLALRPKVGAVVVVTRDLPAGHVLQREDLSLEELPISTIDKDAIRVPEQAVGKTLAIPRSKGDVLKQSHLARRLDVRDNERAIALRVDDASGLAGVIQPGDLVGVVAFVDSQVFTQAAQTYMGPTEEAIPTGDYAKVIAEGLRVVYVSPEFQINTAQQMSESSWLSVGARAKEGAVIVAVPVEPVEVVYDFQTFNGMESATLRVSLVELLSGIQASPNARLSLYWVPQNTNLQVRTAGFWLPQVVTFPLGEEGDE